LQPEGHADLCDMGEQETAPILLARVPATRRTHDEVEEFRFAHDVAIDPCNLNPGPCIPPQGFVDCDSQGLGNIVYYEHRGGGRVLSVSSIHTPRALIIDEDSLGMPLTNELSALVERMLDCALNGNNCP